MFLNRQKRRKHGAEYEYWELVRTVRTASGPRHETVAYLGRLEECEARQRYGWSDIDVLLEGREPDVQLTLDLPGARPETEPAWRRVNVRGVRVERVREFGRIWAALSEDNWNPEAVRRDLRQTLDRLKGLHVEVIMKDISTVRYQPERLWAWSQIAKETAEACG